MSMLFSINPENGNLYALKTFDYEIEKEFLFHIEARDSGIPALSSNVTVHIIIMDQNDNTPVIVSPWRAHGSVVEEKIPRSTDKGSLVAKVIAIDTDSVHNSRITYQFLQNTDATLFSLDQYNGEIRTMRMFSYRDARHQRLVVIAKDNGEPALSATVTIKLSTVETAMKSYSDMTEVPLEYDIFSDLNLYLVIGLGSVSFLLLITILVTIVLKCQKPKPSKSAPPSRNSVASERNSTFADSTLVSNDAYWYSLFLAETRKGKLVVRQPVPKGQRYIVSSLPRSTGLTETSDSAASTLQLSDNETITLELLDVNDNVPKFNQTFYTIQVTENNAPGALLALITAVDPDLHENQYLVYFIIEKDIANTSMSMLFSINPENGHLYALKTFDYEIEKEFLFHIEARDSGVPPLSSNVTVHIIIMDQNDNTPVIVSPWRAHGTVVEEKIPRNTDKGSLVAKVIAIDTDSVHNSRITYQFLQNTDATLFSLDQYNGEIRTMRMFSYRDARHQRLVVIAKDNGEPALSATVTIKLSTVETAMKSYSDMTEVPLEYDIFSDLNLYLVIGLGSVSFLLLITILVTIVLKCQKPKPSKSAPPSRNSVASERNSTFADSTLVSNDAYWYSLFLAETRKGKLVVRQPVPKGQRYIVSSLPRSTGLTETSDSAASTLQLSDNETITLELLDVNDNVPKFNQTFYTIQVTENNAPGALLALVTAVDPDLHENQYLVYFIIEKDIANTSMSMLFSINPENGHLYALKTFDYEIEKEFLFHIEARDSGVPPLRSNVTVHIIIMDQNDNTPVIVSPWRAHGTVVEEKIPRNTDKGSLVAKVIAVDTDSVHNSRITYQFLQNTDATLFSLDQYNGEIRTMRMFSYRDARHQRLVVIAKDNGEPALSATVTIKLSTVETAMKSYSDMTEVPLEYDIFSDLNLYLVIGLGSVSFLLLITILVTIVLKCQKPKPSKSAPPSRNSVASERNSTFADSTLVSNDAYWYSLFLAETRKGKLVVRQPVPKGQRYIVSSLPRSTGLTETSDSAASTLQNGHLYALKTFDYEIEKEFLFHVEARDSGVSPLSSNVTVHIIIMDQNDNTPVIVSPWRAHGTVVEEKIPRNTDKGSLVAKVIAIDTDSVHNSRITYQFLQNADATLFSLDQYNGEIRTMRMFSYRDARHQRLVVIAKDNGEPALSATVTIKLSTVETAMRSYSDMTEVPLEYDIFSDINLYLVIGLGSVSFLLLITILVTIVLKCQKPKPSKSAPPSRNSVASERNSTFADSTLVSNDAYWYSLFLAETRKGKLVVRQPVPKGQRYIVSSLPRSTGLTETSDSAASTLQALDREKVPEYDITFTVTDRGNPPLSDNETITLELLDVNDNVPQFAQSFYTIQVIENNAPGALLSSLSAFDPDLHENQYLVYFIIEKEIANTSMSMLFSINPENGNLYALKTFDYEIEKEFLFHIEARDSGVPPLSSNVTVHIIIMDQNDNTPVIVSPWRAHGTVVEEKIPRNTDKGSLVAKVIAIDTDSVHNSRITYQFLQNTDATLFSLDQYNGEIRTMRMFSYRDARHQRLVVIAKDNGEPALSATVTIKLSTVETAMKSYSDMTEVPLEYDIFSDINLYLVIGLGSVSFLLLITILVTIVLKCQKPKPSKSAPPSRNSVASERNSTFADSTLVSNDAYWYSLFLAETRKGKLVVRQPVPKGQRYIVSSLPRSTGLTETSDSAASTLQAGYTVTHYSVPEEMELGSVVANLAADLGLDVKTLSRRRMRLDVVASRKYLDINKETGELYILERIDREYLVSDKDSGDNGIVDVSIDNKLPFTLKESSDNYYELLVSEPLDREKASEYDITFTVSDRGVPPLSDNETITLELLDVNDNVPKFSQLFYTIPVMENNAPGALLSSLTAVDPDLHENQYLVYFIIEKEIANTSMSMLFSINPENGNLYALKTFDYEIEKEFLFHIEARDSGIPPLSSNVTVHIIIMDQNDNTPVIVSPWRAHGSVVEEKIPRNTDKGSLVAKVIAVDTDSVHNSRIAYQFLQNTDATLFSLDQYNGEIRTMRMFSYRDARHQRLVVIAKDNGEPALSATVTIKLSTVETAMKSYSDMTEVPLEYDIFSDLNLYLVIGLGSVSFLLLITILVTIVLKCQKPKPSKSAPPSRNSVASERNSTFADSTLVSNDAYWYSLFLAETRKGKLVVRQPVPKGQRYIVSSLPRSTGLTETSDSAASTLQVKKVV
ncbi:hypothetical protein ACEWY4_026845 [Coilia grayii]|uniref:Cadherin domain-containing protein n=1 Tax=Coilia grayii TaxID=363190 RepID=A0ABD1ISY8_9TELE